MSSEQDDFLQEEFTEELNADEFSAEEGVSEEAVEESAGEVSEEFQPMEEEQSVNFAEDESASEETKKKPEKEEPVMYRPPRMDLYTVLLLLSLLFLAGAAALHFLDVPPSEYGTVPWKKNSPIQAPMN